MGYEKLGSLYLSLTPEDEGILKDRFEWQKAQALPVEFLSRDEVLQMEPTVTKRIRGGTYYPEIQKVHAEKLTSALFQAAQSAGVEIKTGPNKCHLSQKKWMHSGKYFGKLEHAVKFCADNALSKLDAISMVEFIQEYKRISTQLTESARL